MKKTALFISSLLALILFAGCASIPEPKNSEATLLYGAARYNGLYVVGGNNRAISTVKIDGIQLIVKNVDDGMSYCFKTNANGEFAVEGLSAGNYIVKYIGTKYRCDGKVWNLRYNVPVKDSLKFTVNGGVTNLGRIVVNLDPDVGRDYVEWARDLDKVAEMFRKLHPKSKWIEADWSVPAID